MVQILDFVFYLSSISLCSFLFSIIFLSYSDWRIYIALPLSSPFLRWMNLVKFFCLFLQVFFFFKLCCSDLNFPSDLIYAFCFFAETYYLSIPFKRVYPYVLQYFKITALISLTSLSSLLSQCWRDKIDHLCPCKLFVFSFSLYFLFHNNI